jgi:hypothetical protein
MKTIFLLFIIVLLCYKSSYAQNFNKIQFVEPNISIQYDSLKYKVRGKFSNTIYKNEFIYFDVLNKEKLKITIKVEANSSIETVSNTTEKDSIVLAYKDKVFATKSNNIQLTYIDTGIVRINGFSCYGFGFTNLKEPEIYNAIRCIQESENNFTQIDYYGLNEKDFTSSYKNISVFLNGVKTYTNDDIRNMEKGIKEKYSFNIEPIPNVSNKKNPYSYNGKLTIKEKLQHKIVEVRIKQHNNDRYQSFKPNKTNTIFITLQDKEKGTLQKEGEVIFLNEVNKLFAVPFTFSYYNK